MSASNTHSHFGGARPNAQSARRENFENTIYIMLGKTRLGAAGLEIIRLIICEVPDFNGATPAATQPTQPATVTITGPRGDPSIPPADGACPLMTLPPELRRKIFSASLPEHKKLIQPTCGPKVDRGRDQPHKPNALADLLVLNKKMRDEVAEVAYEERTFCIHVHPGFQNAGIEFVHAGRQPLQYLTKGIDLRFAKFGTLEPFGFCRLKKVDIIVFPSNGHRHTAINTYFMINALVRLLHRNSDDESQRITLLRLRIHELDESGGSSWWDSAKARPCETSIYGISDIELVLLAFAKLSRVHDVQIELPEMLKAHDTTVRFVSRLEENMRAMEWVDPFHSEEVERQIEASRFGLEDYVKKRLDGDKGTIIERLTEEDFLDGDGDFNMEYNNEDSNTGICYGTDHGVERSSRVGTRGSKSYTSASAQARKQRQLLTAASMSDALPIRSQTDYLHPRHSNDHAPLAPRDKSQDVAQFMTVFGVNAKEAGWYLDQAGGDLEQASSNFVDEPKLKDATPGPHTPGKRKGKHRSYYGEYDWDTGSPAKLPRTDSGGMKGGSGDDDDDDDVDDRDDAAVARRLAKSHRRQQRQANEEATERHRLNMAAAVAEANFNPYGEHSVYTPIQTDAERERLRQEGLGNGVLLAPATDQPALAPGEYEAIVGGVRHTYTVTDDRQGSQVQAVQRLTQGLLIPTYGQQIWHPQQTGYFDSDNINSAAATAASTSADSSAHYNRPYASTGPSYYSRSVGGLDPTASPAEQRRTSAATWGFIVRSVDGTTNAGDHTPTPFHNPFSTVPNYNSITTSSPNSSTATTGQRTISAAAYGFVARPVAGTVNAGAVAHHIASGPSNAGGVANHATTGSNGANAITSSFHQASISTTSTALNTNDNDDDFPMQDEGY